MTDGPLPVISVGLLACAPLCASPRDLVQMLVPLRVWDLQIGDERNELEEMTRAAVA